VHDVRHQRPAEREFLLIWAILCHDVEEHEARQQGHDTAQQVVARQTGKIDQFKRQYGHHTQPGISVVSNQIKTAKQC